MPQKVYGLGIMELDRVTLNSKGIEKFYQKTYTSKNAGENFYAIVNILN
jgi:hypothetical protein